MIAADTSALVAILRHESEEERIRARLGESHGALISTANLLELQLVLAGKPSPTVWREVESLLDEYAVSPRAFDERQLRLAHEAAIRYGKGRHKAGLNFGDCFAYALAKSENIPLLCTGSDFPHTDIALA